MPLVPGGVIPGGVTIPPSPVSSTVTAFNIQRMFNNEEEDANTTLDTSNTNTTLETDDTASVHTNTILESKPIASHYTPNPSTWSGRTSQRVWNTVTQPTQQQSPLEAQQKRLFGGRQWMATSQHQIQKQHPLLPPHALPLAASPSHLKQWLTDLLSGSFTRISFSSTQRDPTFHQAIIILGSMPMNTEEERKEKKEMEELIQRWTTPPKMSNMPQQQKQQQSQQFQQQYPLPPSYPHSAPQLQSPGAPSPMNPPGYFPSQPPMPVSDVYGGRRGLGPMGLPSLPPASPAAPLNQKQNHVVITADQARANSDQMMHNWFHNIPREQTSQ